MDKEVTKVWTITLIGNMISWLANAQVILTVISILIAISYTIWKWHKEYKQYKKEQVTR